MGDQTGYLCTREEDFSGFKASPGPSRPTDFWGPDSPATQILQESATKYEKSTE
jgi:hypothetical protein